MPSGKEFDRKRDRKFSLRGKKPEFWLKKEKNANITSKTF